VRVDAVVFDMDGLMIDTEAPVQACCQMAASEMGFTLDDEFYVDAGIFHFRIRKALQR